jgi:type II secretory pathway pseudopilin PulG
MRMLRNSKLPSGFLLIEMVVTISVIIVIVSSILTLYSFVFNNERRENNKLQASLLAQEAMEAVSFVARYDWNEMQDGTWHPEIEDAVWKLDTGSELLDNRFTRSIVIDPVSRAQTSNGHAYGEIVAVGGTDDPETKLVTVMVTWTEGLLGARDVTYEMYQARDESLLFSQVDWSGGPGQTDFVDSSMFASGDNVDYSAPGVLALAGSFITWDNATTTAEFDLPGNVNAASVFVVGETLYIGTLDNNPGGNAELYIFDISDLSSPLLLGSIDIGDDVNDIYVDGSYAALASSSNTGELQIYDISAPASITLIRSIDLPTNDNGLSLDVSNGVLFLAQGGTVYSFDYTDPTDPLQVDSLVVGSGVLYEVSAQGNKVYVASDIDDREFAVIDASDPANIVEIGRVDLPSNRQAIAVYAFGFYAFLGTTNDGAHPEFYMFRISDPFNPVVAGTYEVGEKLATVSALSNFAFVGSNLGGDDVLVLDVTDPLNILIDTGYEIKGTATAVFPTPEAIYLATTSNDSELIIVSVNSDEDLYPESGYAESSTFDTQSATSTYNWIEWFGDVPTDTAIKFQIATNNDKSSWSYLGPDGTTSSYYTLTTRELINYISHLNKRYIRYKVTLETDNDNNLTPYLYGVDISFSR